MPGGTSWPKISVVTPSLNQGGYIEETIRSVLLQAYPNLEYIVIDGGSTDGSLAIIKKYSDDLAYWISEKDDGQTQAINKGLRKATGEILCYLNSDDRYEAGTFAVVAGLFSANPEAELIAGGCTMTNATGQGWQFRSSWPNHMSHFLATGSSTFVQAASFWRRSLTEHIGLFDESLQYCFDREFFLRAGLSGVTPLLVNNILAQFRIHSDSKTATSPERFYRDSISIIQKHARACGVSQGEAKDRVSAIERMIDYRHVLNKFDRKGKGTALGVILRAVYERPSLLTYRPMLGLARQMLFFGGKRRVRTQLLDHRSER